MTKIVLKKFDLSQSITRLFRQYRHDSTEIEMICSKSMSFGPYWAESVEVDVILSILRDFSRHWDESVEIQRISSNFIRLSWKWRDEVVRIKKNVETFRWLFEKMLLGRDQCGTFLKIFRRFSGEFWNVVQMGPKHPKGH